MEEWVHYELGLCFWDLVGVELLLSHSWSLVNNITIKLKHVKNSVHLACLGFSLLADHKYSRFLW